MSAITIFGATGDLMHQKLMPALANLHKVGKLPEKAHIFCVGRRDWNTDEFIAHLRKHVAEAALVAEVENIITYVKVDLDNRDDYHALDRKISTVSNADDRIFYLALPPKLFPEVARELAQANLVKKGDDNQRVVFEKPFGEDFESAKEINRLLWRYFDESQIYRIDHYLGKEMIQNIITLRFANRVFESDWHKDSIEKITIYAKEKSGIKDRGGYYDATGALRDMVQSHLLQMLALTTMEAPESFSAKAIRKEKVSLLKKVSVDSEHVIMGQYRGYHDEKKVADDSKTETLVKMDCIIDDSRWRGVPITILTGKNMDEKRSEIIIDFKAPSQAASLWPQAKMQSNCLIIKIAPEEGMRFTMNIKESGLSDEITTKTMDYNHGSDVFGNKPEAYEKLFLEIIDKNPLMFTRWDEIETAWRLIDSIRDHDTGKRVIYEPGCTLQQCLKGV